MGLYFRLGKSIGGLMNKAQFIFSAIGGVIVSTLGGADTLLKVFITIIFLDIATGVIKSLYEGNCSSQKFRRGLYGKMAYFIAIILVVQLDQLTGNSGMFRSVLVTFLVCNEMISIIENLGILGVPFPKVIVTTIEVLKDKNNQEQKG